MEDKNLEKMMKEVSKKSRPRKVFAAKMRYRVWKKGMIIYFTGTHAARHLAGATLVVVLFFGGGGVGTYAYASPDVNLNHPLYPVKQGIESIEGGFAFTPEQKADFFMKKAMRRLDEAEVMHNRLRERLEAEQEAMSVEETLEMINQEMERSFESAEGEFDPARAEELVQKMEQRCGMIRDRLDKLPPLENGRPHISSLRERMMSLDQNALNRMEQLKEIEQTVQQAREGRQRRVMLHFMMPPPPSGEAADSMPAM